MIDNEQSTLLAIVETWRPNQYPEYRGFRCANCQEYKNEAWYHWLNTGGYILPIHLCNEVCEPKFQSGTMHISQEKRVQIDRKRFGNAYQYSKQAIRRFHEIVKSWPDHEDPRLKAFTCDDCNVQLKIHILPNGKKQRQAYHLWWNMSDKQTLVELHFHKSCANKFGIYSKEEIQK